MIAAWKVPSTLYVVWASMGMAKRRVAKSVRIEGDDLRDILISYVNVRCGDVSSSYQLSSGRTASQTEDAKGVDVVEGCGVRLDNGRWCLHRSVLCGEINGVQRMFAEADNERDTNAVTGTVERVV